MAEPVGNIETVAPIPPPVITGEKKEHSNIEHPIYRYDDYNEEIQGVLPTDEEFHTLRRVSDKIPWKVYTIAFVELCERFSYYGTTVVFTNFIQQPLPTGSTTGAGGADGQSGALGKQQQASTGITTFNQFWVYVIPLFGAYMADAHWGRYKTIVIALAFAIVGHIIIVSQHFPPYRRTTPPH
ncbi:hypothetical protein G7Y89_g11802 [Cudoniella acicularis]|uniref:Uncharacterized protein n=1 Tax=Cudoniella acicularis TaxID=354080 RepID=A0A8H4W0A6_9HELO|nr:hypothetical protein G7Y89_g11802 [Cudoniella acicularis]